jgi:aspartate aminotransferase
VLINTPHNPTGVVYPESTLRELGRLLQTKSRETGRTIYLLSDEPYRKIVYDNVTVPSIFQCYDESIVVTSYSKDLSIPGERLGYIAINPKTMETGKLFEAMTLTNRILGFVNAPAFMQRVVEKAQGAHVDVSEYARKRALICDGLKEAGYDFVTPGGAFYVFPKSPIESEVDFVQALQDELILAVPGGGFGKPGYFRLVYCVSDETIKGAMPGFKRVMDKFR